MAVPNGENDDGVSGSVLTRREHGGAKSGGAMLMNFSMNR